MGRQIIFSQDACIYDVRYPIKDLDQFLTKQVLNLTSNVKTELESGHLN